MKINRYISSIGLVIALSIKVSGYSETPVISTPGQQSHTTGFIENKGQILDQDYRPNEGVKYLYCSPGFNVQLRNTGFSYDTYSEDTIPPGKSAVQPAMPPDGLTRLPVGYLRHYHRVDVELLNCNANAEIVPESPSEGYYNYFTAGVPAGGVAFVHAYQSVMYKNIYPEIDLVFYLISPGTRSGKGMPGIEYDFIVHPGGDVSAIQLSYNGANDVNLQDGQLHIQVTSGTFAESIPKSYLRESGQEIEVHYNTVKQNVYSFSLPEGFKNSSSDLVIDPTPCLQWGTYYGGTSVDYAFRMALDTAGNICTTGLTYSTQGIATSGAYQTTIGISPDVCIAKFNAGGALLWGTYYGGPGTEGVLGIAADDTGNIYITGCTTSTTGIATAGAYQTVYAGGSVYGDVFIAEFNSTGSALLWGTYYGGPNEDAAGSGIVIDKNNHVYIGGFTSSTSGIATPGAWQTTYNGASTNYGTSANSFVAEFNPANTGTAQLVWGSYYGGTGLDHAKGIAIDAVSNVYITGSTSSNTGIATFGAYQTSLVGSSEAFVAKFNSTGTNLIWATYYGGPSTADGYRIDVDAGENVFFSGFTTSTTGIATPGAYQTTSTGDNIVYVAQLNRTGTSLLWGTYYDGSYSGYIVGGVYYIGLAMALDANSNVYITGGTSTPGLATTGAYQTTLSGLSAYVAKFNTEAQLIWDTYYGGTNGALTFGIGVNDSNDVYIAGLTSSINGIATTGAYQDSLAGINDIFVAKFGCNIDTTPDVKAQFIASNNNFCPGGAVAFTDLSLGSPTSWQWTFTGGTPASSTLQDPTVIYASAGIYDVQLIVSNATTSDTLTETGYITAASNWADVGLADFSASTALYDAIALDAFGTPYVVYQDGSGKATVMKYNDTAWVNVGSPDFSAGDVIYTDIAIDTAGTPYVVYTDYANSNNATVMKYNGSSWVDLGSVSGYDVFTSIAIDPSGTPYIAFKNELIGSTASVAKYNGSSFVNVGNPGFSPGQVNNTVIAIDPSGTPYVVFQDLTAYDAVVMKYDGTSWVTVGAPGASPNASYPSIAIDPTGVPYIGYVDGGYGNQGTVMKYVDSSWIFVGTPGFSNGFSSIAIDASGTPYILCADTGSSGKIAVMKYNGTTWVYVGTPGFSAAGFQLNYSALAISPLGKPFVVYPDGQTSQFKATVMSLCTNTLVLPSAAFLANTTTVCAGSMVTFTDQSTGSPTSWNWTFSGGTPGNSNSPNPKVTYATAGTYYVKLVISNSVGTDSLTKTTYITVNPQPVAGMVTGPGTICSGSSAELSDTGSTGRIQWQSSADGISFTNITGDTSSSYNLSSLSQTTYYRVSASGNCGTDSSAAYKLLVDTLPVPSVSTPDSLICSNDSTWVCAQGAFASYRWNTGDTSSCTVANYAGGFWVTVTDANGCAAISRHQNISVYPVPTVSISVLGNTLTSFNSVSYQWLFNDSIIPGATSDVYVAHQSGGYAVQVTDSNGCTTLSNYTNVVLTGISTLVESDQLSVYPNPFNTSVFIERGNTAIDIDKVEVYDLPGGIIFSRNYETQSSLIRIDLSEMAPGIYYLKIKSKEVDYIYKMIKCL